MKTYYPKNMYRVKKGKDFFIIKCDDQMILEEMIDKNQIDEYEMLKVYKVN